MDTTAAGITLPLAFSRESPASILEAHVYVAACIKFLGSPLVSSLLECHPNDIAIHGPRLQWDPWWKWAAAGKARWKLLIPGWGSTSPDTVSDVPDEIKLMLGTVDQLTLPRTLNLNLILEDHAPLRGMSPKKAHEVSQMSAFIQSVLSRSETDIRHIVDIGAGQGYLSRVLSSFPISKHVIALDSSEVQTKGAERRSSNIQKKLAKTTLKSGAECCPSDMPGNLHTSTPAACGDPSSMSSVANGSLTHEMISITPQTLHSSVSRWISDQSTCQTTPVMLVALHACGTLTPDILRCFLATQDPQKSWYAAALVVVGCCYNLMSPDSDFPLSEPVAKELKNEENKLHLSYNHRSLAAQSPLQWPLNATAKAAAELALRKVVYRALFGKLASMPGRPVKVGRLRDSSYSSLERFISEASKKADIQVIPPVEEPVELISCLEVLHALRSRIGPVIESLIIVDRYLYLAEKAYNSDVLAFNLFDQELGSSRNSALAVLPHKSPRNA
ncbi:methyltransferase domain-containing protein [Gautieria morchelliformis]|nr:methyltransferase domain-containing protein [Gautieria morchelliformis]